MAERTFPVTGTLDLATAATVQDQLLMLVYGNRDDLVLDCTDLSFIDSTGIAVFAYTQRLLANQGRGFRVTNLTGSARMPFDVLGLIDAFGIADDAEPAW